jgi:indole-3-glycerol phosphate synthase
MKLSILERILAARRQRVERAMATTSEDNLRRRAASSGPVRDFAAALRQSPYALIAEIKKGSPSRGILRADLDCAALAVQYEAGGASALSVVTEPEFFSGDTAWLAVVRSKVRCPLLQKDFFFSPWQVWESRVLGADAILIILAMIDDRTAAALLETAAESGMYALVEVHNEAEAARATRLGADIVGVNNRDLASFDVDLAVSERLVSHLPPGAVRVSESGISSRADCERLSAAGFQAFLVGEALVTSSEPDMLLRAMRGTDASR